MGDAPQQKVSVPRCHIPWQQMVIDSTGYVAPCCYWGAIDNNNPAIGNINENTIEEIWNGSGYQNLRAGMAAGDLAAAGCANCQAVRQGMGLGFEYDPECENEGREKTPYAENIAILKQEIATGATVLKASPTIVSFTPSHKCNIRCTHCYQESTRSAVLARTRADDEVAAMAPYLVRLVAGGGEPFLLPIWRKFLSNFNLNSNPYLDFSTSTNATLITKQVLDGLGRFKRLTLNVSLDGTGSAFERVRVGAKFEQVRDNIRKLKTAARAARHPASAVGVSMCVMKSNITDLPNFIRYVTDERLAFGLSPVATMPPDESLRCFNDLGAELVGWAEALDEAEALVQNHYLPTMVADRGETFVQDVEKSFWHNNFNLLRNTIPFKLLETPHYKVKVSIPSYMVDNAHVPADQGRVVVYIYQFDKPTEAPLYWAYLENNQIEVSLPKGAYSINIWTKWAVAGYWDQVRFCVGVENQTPITADYYTPVQRPLDRNRWNEWLRRVDLPFDNVRISLPAELFEKFPALDDNKSNAIVHVLGMPFADAIGRFPIRGRHVDARLPEGEYCITTDLDFARPEYWDVVQVAVPADGAPVIAATFHPYTRRRVKQKVSLVLNRARLGFLSRALDAVM